MLGEAGEGFRYAQVRLSPARLSHCMRWLGGCIRAHEIATVYANRREAFGKALIDHEGVGFMLAENMIDLKQAELMIDWCAGVLDELRQRSPVALKVTLRHIREARSRDLRQTLAIDYRLACRLMQSHDFQEGVRTLLTDGDRKPRWSPGRVEAVTEAMVERFFAFEPGGELVLPTRQEMQAARV